MLALLIFLTVLVIIVAFIVGWIGDDAGTGGLTALAATIFLGEAWLLGLVIYVAQHFIVKYW